jgi:hypothetical protein
MKLSMPLAAAAALALTGFAGAASAQTLPTEVYGSLGYTQFGIDQDGDDFGVDDSELNFGAVTGRAGAKLNRYFGAEGELQIGVNDSEENLGGGVTVSAGLNYSASVFAVGYLPVAPNFDLLARLGPDPLRPDWDPALAVARLGADPTRPLIAALLDQRVLAGLGNLWVNELCFLRGVSPWTPVGEVDLPALVALARRCLRHSALVPGAYQVTTGRNRSGEDHWVAGRAGLRCRRCGTAWPSRCGGRRAPSRGRSRSPPRSRHRRAASRRSPGRSTAPGRPAPKPPGSRRRPPPCPHAARSPCRRRRRGGAIPRSPPRRN